MNFIEVATAWIRAFNPTSEQQEIADYRMKICNDCEKKTYLKSIDMFICGECGCPLNKKIFSPKPGLKACPLSKWEK
jgi:hypothetical protein